ncbi:ATP-binding protein [Rhodospirillum centenum]|uniref:histidine kinase n=1 Tax=Rhodospirillum centenum (strain ATCC 51521 / SW) TaxID=414684 RepID=B6IWZ9_RHOCS|nr:ATP-binding protein [Rhodospirillum centenum]ACJ00823.1 sensory box histidine kinase [Rhodospirillum centenum SW]
MLSLFRALMPANRVSASEAEELQHAVRALRAWEGALREAAGAGPVVLFVQDCDLRYLWATDGVSLHPDGMIGRTDHDIPPSPDQRLLITTKQRVLKTGTAERLSFPLSGPEGGQIFDLRLTPMRAPDGRVVGLTGIGIDVTHERMAARAAEQSEMRLRLALRVAPVTIFTQDRNLRYTWVYNLPKGLRNEDFLGRTDLMLDLPGVGLAEMYAFKKRVLESGRGDRQTFRMPARDGTDDHWTDIAVEPQRENGVIVGLTGIAIDVTADMRRKAEAEAAKLEAERANRAKSRFLAAASHDLRQPFQAMRLFLHLLESRLEDATQIDLAHKLGESLDSGETLLNALLELSALEAATVTPSLATVPVAPMLRRLAQEFAPQAAVKGLRLRVVPASVDIRSDPVLLDRMLRNLLSNAVRNTAGGGLLLGARRQDGHLRLEVWDTGSGIPAEKQQAIFEEFVQLDDGPRDRRQGLGLGLAIVQRTAQLLGHRVGVRSVPGKGSCFSVTVPVAAAVAPAAGGGGDGEAQDGSRGIVVAVAEDDRLQLAALEAMLTDWGLRPVAAPDAPGLLAALERLGRAPELVISDYRLPGGGLGTDLIAQVRTRFGAAVPGMLLTGDTHPDLLEQAGRLGIAIEHKPIHPNRLRRTIEAAIGTDLRRRA